MAIRVVPTFLFTFFLQWFLAAEKVAELASLVNCAAGRTVWQLTRRPASKTEFRAGVFRPATKIGLLR
jgi:hypothetical protein